MRRATLTVALTLAALSAARAAGADEPPIRKLRVLLAIDTASNLKDSVVLDQQRMTRLLKANVPPGMLDLHTLTGTQVSAEAVLRHYRSLKTGPDEALLFYYAGHGAKDPAKGNAFVPQMNKVPPIYRSDVLTEMKKTGAGLVVLLTDCCSTRQKLVGKPFYGATRPVTPAGASALHPTLEALFFRHRGVVDVTAASDGQASWSDLKDGGVFTRSLARQLGRPPAELAGGPGRSLTWKDFFPSLRRETEGTFRSWSAKMRAVGEEIDQSAQVPASFALADPVPRPGGGGDKASSGGDKPAVAQVHAVVCLVNESGEEVRYRYRWSENAAWQTAALAPRKRAEHSTPAGPRGLPPFQVLFDGNTTVIDLEPDPWTGKTPPSGAAGREYPILLRKPGE